MLEKIKNKNTIVLLILSILLFAVFYRLFINSILTNGDWLFHFSESCKQWFNFPFAWNVGSFGSLYLTSYSYLIYLLYGLFSNIFNISSNILDKLVFYIPIIIFYIGSYFLFYKFFRNKIASAVSVVAFFSNVYMLTIFTGHITILAAFSLAPLILYFFIRTLEEKKITLAIMAGLLCTLSSFYEFRSFYIIAFILLFYTIYYTFFIDKIYKKNIFNNLKFAIIPVLIVVLLNFFWIFGLFKLNSITTNEIFGRGLFGDSFMNILRSMTLFHPFWSGGLMESFVVHKIPIYFFLIPIFVFFGLFLNKKNKNIVFFGFISLLGILLAKQSGQPFTSLYKWLYDNFPGFNAFRESSKFYFLIAFGYSVLLGAFIDWVFKNLNKNRFQKITKYILIIVSFSLFLWNAKPIITGEIETLFVPRTISNDYIILKKFILKQPKFFRTYYTPRDSRWGIYTNEKPKVSNIDIIQSDWSNYIGYSGDANSWPVQDQIVDIYKKDFSNQLFDNSSIKYIIIPLQDKENDDDFFIYYGGQENSNIRQWYINELDKIDWLKKIDINTKDLVIYENKNYKDHIYSTNEIDSIYKDIISNNIEYKFINPTEYKISLKNISKASFINFTDKFNSEWKLRLGKFNWINVLTNKNYFIDDSYHVNNDAGLNSFKIDPEYIKKNFDKSYYKENPDGSIDIELTLYFKPQSYFYLGLIISGTTLIGCITYLIIDQIKNQKQKTKKQNGEEEEEEKLKIEKN